MDRYEVRRQVERAFARGSKNDLYKVMRTEDLSSLIEVLWDYMKESDDSSIAKKELQELREKIKALDNKSGQRVRCIKLLPNRRALIQLGPLKEEVLISPSVDTKQLKPGTEVLIIGSPEGRMLAAIREPVIYDGRLSKIQRMIDNKRAVIEDGGHELILKTADWVTCKEGDEVRYDLESLMILEVISAKEKSAFALSEIPKQTLKDVKGLEEEKEHLKENLIYPLIHNKKFKKYGLSIMNAALFHGPPGCGKAQPLDSDIITPHGYIKMKDVREGSMVSTPDGHSARVLEIFPQGKLDIYKITFSDGTSTECCLDHLWSVFNKDWKCRNKIVTLKQIKQSGIKEKNGYYKFSIPSTKPVVFNKNEPLSIDPYLLGVLLGNDCFGLSGDLLRLSCSEKELSQLCSDVISKNKNHMLKKSDKNHFRLINFKRIRDKNILTNELRDMGLWKKDSKKKFIPDKYKISSIESRIGLLQGLFDSNGCPDKYLKRVHYVTTSKKLSEDVKFIVESLGGICSIYIKENCIYGTSYSLYIDLPSFMPFKLKRKVDTYSSCKRNNRIRKIVSIDFIGNKESQCILINHPEHLYLTNNFIVTHNTYLAGAVFNEMLNLKVNFGSSLKEKTSHKGFFVINGPECLEKWAGNTEEKIRKIFEEARKAAKSSDFPSIIFWDEIESITGKRKDTATYTPEKTVVPTLLAELNGIKSSNNVVLIGATNRPDLIDPALMRPGRLGDLILEIPRPTKEASVDILNAQFNRVDLPEELKNMLNEDLVNKLVSYVYDNPKALAMAKLKSGGTSAIMRQEIVNGALFSKIGEKLIRKTCMEEINNEKHMNISKAIKMLDNMMLSQIGILDAGVKNGFTFNTSDYVIDVSLNA